jgi:hypothetical protein
VRGVYPVLGHETKRTTRELLDVATQYATGEEAVQANFSAKAKAASHLSVGDGGDDPASARRHRIFFNLHERNFSMRVRPIEKMFLLVNQQKNLNFYHSISVGYFLMVHRHLSGFTFFCGFLHTGVFEFPVVISLVSFLQAA